MGSPRYIETLRPLDGDSIGNSRASKIEVGGHLVDRFPQILEHVRIPYDSVSSGHPTVEQQLNAIFSSLFATA